jgi:hypothetical protein
VIKSCRPSESPPSKRVDQLPHTLGEPQNGSRGDLGVFKWIERVSDTERDDQVPNGT